MAERLSEIEARIDSIRQLSTVVGTMRGIAAARSSEARRRLAGIRAYAGTIGGAVAQALALIPRASENFLANRVGKRVVFAFGSQQGFVGAFNTRVLDALDRVLVATAGPPAEVLLVGNRVAALAEERSLSFTSSMPMAAHLEEVTALANRIADALFDRIDAGGVTQVQVVHASPAGGAGSVRVAIKDLVPFDFSRFAPISRLQPPLIQLPVPMLLARLADEYIFAELCEALVLSFTAENEARMQAMVAARQNISRRFDELTASARRLRQEQITDEVIELAAGTIAQC
jgi:F-type H+-transporting ATPase subunit gamma